MKHHTFAAPLFLTVFLSACSCAKLPIDPSFGGTQVYVPKDSTTFAVIGDFGDNSQQEYDVAQMVKSWNPEFVITTGDNNYSTGSAGSIVANIGDDYCDFIYNPDAPEDRRCNGKATQEKTNRFFPSPGNHDNYSVPALKPYLDYFTLPGDERNYDFIWGPVHFFSLNSGINGNIDGSAKEWLHKKLVESKVPFKVVYFHHPPYSSGNHGSNSNMQLPFTEWGVDAVFCGHDHLFERIIDKSVSKPVYYIMGNSGNTNLYSCKAHVLDATRFDVKCDNTHWGALKVKAGENICVIEYYTKDDWNNPADVYVLHK